MNGKKIIKKAENFWYYYKWYLLGGILLAAALIIGTRSCVLKTNPDLYILFGAETSPNSVQLAELEAQFAEMAEDVNGDEEKTAQILVAATADQWAGGNTATLLVQVNSGNAVLYILSESTYQTLHDNGVLQDLSGYESAYIEGDRYCLTDSGVLGEMAGLAESGEKYYLAIRKVEGTTLEGEEKHETQERLAKSILQQLVELEK